MKVNLLLDELEQKELLTPAQRVVIGQYEKQKPVSLFIYLRTLLYLSISAFIGGIGVLIYENIDTVGHTILISILALVTVGCFVFVFRKGTPYRPEKVVQTTHYFDTVLLLGCLLFLTLEGYAQYQYELFGTRYGLAVIIPAIFFFYLAYRYDHQGVLSLAITALASWVGLTATPSELLVKNDFSDPAVIRASVIFGAIILTTARFLKQRGIKPHFTYTYVLLAGTLYLAACTGGMFTQDRLQLLFGVLLGIGCWDFFKNAQDENSLLLLLISVIFGYTGITYLLFNNLLNEFMEFLASFYLLASAAGVVWFFVSYKKILKRS
ncbi:DUF2157 domain-containing protein [Salmonirosea aquatica]|uniref:DUF2157 domain-containing protein n=1 Tax=Salmonirosea aquatica TaxID=2654236 RepID=A0A7C9BJJ5_9BACT|nr:DUF2157 domain-containing protein [Cytophagaceae bacterium SJW1-29]